MTGMTQQAGSEKEYPNEYDLDRYGPDQIEHKQFDLNLQ